MEALTGWRKVIVTLAVTLPVETVATLAWLVWHQLTADQWISFNQWIVPWAVGLFIAGNGVEHVMDAKKAAAGVLP